MNKMLVLLTVTLVSAVTAVAQLPRLGATISNNTKMYFGIGRRSGNHDSMKVVKGSGVTFLGMRRDSIVDSVVFSADEVPTLERYLRDYEKLLASKTDLFVSDTGMRRILGRVAPRQFADINVLRVSVRLSSGSVKTGVPMVATQDNLLIAEGEAYDPAVDLPQQKFTCIPVTLIEDLTPDVGAISPRWFKVRGDHTYFNTAVRLSGITFAYMQSFPPEFEACINPVTDNELKYADVSKVCPRSADAYVTAFSGVVASVMRPDAFAELPFGSRFRRPSLDYQPVSFTSGVEASMYVSELHDIGFRAMLVAQPPTVQDSTVQNSLGMDAYSFHLLGTWHITPLDAIGFNTVGVSATLGVGPSILSYRARTYRDAVNLTTSGSGLTLDFALSVNMQVWISKSFTVGLRGYSMYQHGLSNSIESIVDERPNQMPWEVLFIVSQQSAAFFGAQLFVSYSL